MEYPKIDTLFERDESFNVTSVLRHPAFDAFKYLDITEKIDGTNIRIMLDAVGNMKIGGRTDNAQIPGDLVQYLWSTFNPEKLKSVFWRPNNDGVIEPVSVVLYGEGYGAGIQKVGGNYRKDKSFRLFDVLIDEKYWLDWPATCEIADKLGIKTVPYLGRWSLDEIVERVKTGIKSVAAQEDSGTDFQAEGVIGRTPEPLFDKRGKRLILKLKTIDFTHH